MTFINQELYPGEFALHRKYARSELLLSLVWTHSHILMEIALDLYDRGTFPKEDIPREALAQACLLCEVGTYLCDGFEFISGQTPTGHPYSQHTIIGAWILNREGYPGSIVQAAYTHAKVGFTAQDVQMYALDLPVADYSPQTNFLKLISYATKFHSKAPKFRTSAEIYESLQRYGTEKVKTFETWAQLYGEPQLTPLMEKYKEWHLAFNYQLAQLQQPNGAQVLHI